MSRWHSQGYAQVPSPWDIQQGDYNADSYGRQTWMWPRNNDRNASAMNRSNFYQMRSDGSRRMRTYRGRGRGSSSYDDASSNAKTWHKISAFKDRGREGSKRETQKLIETENLTTKKKQADVSESEKERLKKVEKDKKRITMALKSDKKITTAEVKSSLKPVASENGNKEPSKLELSCVGQSRIELTESDYREIGSMNDRPDDEEPAEEDRPPSVSSPSPAVAVSQKQKKDSVSSQQPTTKTVECFKISSLDSSSEDNSIYTNIKTSTNDAPKIAKGGAKSRSEPSTKASNSVSGESVGESDKATGFSSRDEKPQPIKRVELKLQEINSLPKIRSMYKSFLRYRRHAKCHPSPDDKLRKQKPPFGDNPLLNKSNLILLSEDAEPDGGRSGPAGDGAPADGGCADVPPPPPPPPPPDAQVDEFMEIFGHLLDDNYEIPKETLEMLGLGQLLAQVEDDFDQTNQNATAVSDETVVPAERKPEAPTFDAPPHIKSEDDGSVECINLDEEVAELSDEINSQNDDILSQIDLLVEDWQEAGNKADEKAAASEEVETPAVHCTDVETPKDKVIPSNAVPIKDEKEHTLAAPPPTQGDLIFKQTNTDSPQNQSSDSLPVRPALESVIVEKTEAQRIEVQKLINFYIAGNIQGIEQHFQDIQNLDGNEATDGNVHVSEFMDHLISHATNMAGTCSIDIADLVVSRFIIELLTCRCLSSELKKNFIAVLRRKTERSCDGAGRVEETALECSKGVSDAVEIARPTSVLDDFKTLYAIDKEMAELNRRKFEIYGRYTDCDPSLMGDAGRDYVPAECELRRKSVSVLFKKRKRAQSYGASSTSSEESSESDDLPYKGIAKKRKRMPAKAGAAPCDAVSAQYDPLLKRNYSGELKACSVVLVPLPAADETDDSISSDRTVQIVRLSDEDGDGGKKKLKADSETKLVDLIKIATLEKGWQMKQNSAIRTLKVYDGDLFMGRDDGQILRFKQKGVVLDHVYSGHSKGVNCIGAYQRVLVSGSSDNIIKLFNLSAPHQCIATIDIKEEVQCLDINWGTVFAGTRSGAVYRLSCKTHNLVGERFTVGGPHATVLALRTSKEGPRKIIIVSARACPLTIRDAATGLLLHSLRQSETVYTIALQQSSPMIYCGTMARSVLMVDPTVGEERGQLQLGNGVVKIIIRWNVIFTASYDGKVHMYNLETESLITDIHVDGVIIEMELWNFKIVITTTKEPVRVIDFPPQLIKLLTG